MPNPIGRMKGAGIGRQVSVVAAAAAVFVLAAFGLIPCTFARLTHLPCPGCGSTRAVWALFRGDLRGILANNPFGPMMALLLVLLVLDGAFHARRRGSDEAPKPMAARSRWLLRGIGVIAVLEVVLWGARFFGLFGGPVTVG